MDGQQRNCMEVLSIQYISFWGINLYGVRCCLHPYQRYEINIYLYLGFLCMNNLNIYCILRTIRCTFSFENTLENVAVSYGPEVQDNEQGFTLSELKSIVKVRLACPVFPPKHVLFFRLKNSVRLDFLNLVKCPGFWINDCLSLFPIKSMLP